MTTVEELEASGLIVLKAVCGSQSFGLATETSDTDIHGVFIASPAMLSALDGTPIKSIHDERCNTDYWEMRHFLEMLRDGKPNALELLHSPESCVLYRNDRIMDLLKPYDQFVSNLCGNTFRRYAMTQIDKARGDNKKIVNPVPKKRKSVLDFCYVISGGKSIPLLNLYSVEQLSQYGLAGVAHAPNTYAMYAHSAEDDTEFWPRGIVKDIESSNEPCLSSVPKGIAPVCYLYWNKDGYAQHCKKYREYWQWVKDRNDVRYAGTMAHGKGYDAKNMMHTFRLLHMGLEIVSGKGVQVDRTFERDYLLAIKSGAREYDDLVAEATVMAESLAAPCTLPEPVSVEVAEAILTAARVMHWKNLSYI